MNLTNDQKFKMLVGEYAVQIITLETQLVEVAAKLAETEAENAKLKAEIAVLTPPAKDGSEEFKLTEEYLATLKDKPWRVPQNRADITQNCGEGVANGRDTHP